MADNHHQVHPETNNETPNAPDRGLEKGGTSTSSQLFKKRKKKIPQNQIRKRTIDSEPVTTTTQDDSEKDNEPSVVNKNKKSKLEAEDDDDSKPQAVGVAYQALGSARQQAEESYQKAILEKRELGQQAREGLSQDQAELEADTESKVYLGTSKSKYQLPKGSQKYGPIKGGPNNIKTITVVDYQPDVCKDYKETGYCGFGDTCKVFSCMIEPFNDPIVTKCQHYFCSGCAIKRFAKTPKCFACGTPTSGIFNKASRIIEKMNAKQERIKRQKEERRLEEEGLAGIEGLETRPSANQALDDEEQGSERSFYEDE
ncbi:hypothetical protein PtA15_17A374 [Puccinia triticina]|uniref:Pre-mRNA-splicing factor CWC24 n=1 Tax=Puccinia triticina TaxID=208348 RepID=A0ABY7DD40_9BASI|nr:uncharacterized protein PtA15_17A374 [Puccinia triticina]WAQ92892.1 hypothetical protein PtA15_17A374 [Puccinia triticina]